MYIRQLKLGPMDNFVYLLGADGAKETAIVDPAWDVGAALEQAERDGRQVTHAFVSHRHHDHVNGLPDLLAGGGVRVHVHEAEVPHLAPEVRGEVSTLEAGDAVEVGPLRVEAVHTPGHTEGSTCFAAHGALFAGDTVFVNGCGRCDFAGGSPEQMFESLRRIAALPEDTRLYPGHDYGDVPVSSVGREKERNPYFLKLASLTDFVAYRMRPRR